MADILKGYKVTRNVYLMCLEVEIQKARYDWCT